MKPAHSPGEYQTQTLTRPINDADNLVGSAPRLLINLIPFDIQHRVDDICKQFTGAGWKNLPQEIVDEIFSYLLDNLAALEASSQAPCTPASDPTISEGTTARRKPPSSITTLWGIYTSTRNRTEMCGMECGMMQGLQPGLDSASLLQDPLPGSFGLVPQ